MTIPLWCLLGFVGWMFLLLLAIGVSHFVLVGSGRAQPADLRADVAHGGDAHGRLHRAHLNCVETLPAFASMVLIASVTGLQSALLDALAGIFLAARVAQSLTHVTSGSNLAVKVRLTLFLVQWGCLVGFGLTILHSV